MVVDIADSEHPIFRLDRTSQDLVAKSICTTHPLYMPGSGPPPAAQRLSLHPPHWLLELRTGPHSGSEPRRLLGVW